MIWTPDKPIKEPVPIRDKRIVEGLIMIDRSPDSWMLWDEEDILI